MILAVLGGYVSGQIDRQTFQEWFIPATWDVRRLNPEEVRLVREIQHSLAEFSSGDISEEELRGDFRRLLSPRVTLTWCPNANELTLAVEIRSCSSQNQKKSVLVTV